MTTILLVVHLLLALALIGVVLMQRSEGGALGIGGGGMGSLFSSRGAANVLTRATAFLAVGFFITSIALTMLARAGPGTGIGVRQRATGCHGQVSRPAGRAGAQRAAATSRAQSAASACRAMTIGLSAKACFISFVPLRSAGYNPARASSNRPRDVYSRDPWRGTSS